MSTKKENRIRELRKIIGRTQTEFAMMIGSTKDTVASWEIERNQLSPQFAKRIEFATGAEASSLLGKRGRLMGRGFAEHLVPYTRALYDKHTQTRLGRSDHVNARGHARTCGEALELLFVAAARPVRGKQGPLPGVVQSFIQWCEVTRRDFKLERQIDQQLDQRKQKLELTHSWGQWRRMQKEDPDAARVMKFKDNRRKPDRESLTLRIDTVPVWMPGYPMRGGGR